MMPGLRNLLTPSRTDIVAISEHVDRSIARVLAAFPSPAQLSADQRRGIIARYTAVLEGNFIYWMTGAYLAVRSDEARGTIRENLLEEVRDSHPLMMRRFASAAQAVPTDSDARAVNGNLTKVRLFIGCLSPVPILVTMAFFEGLIQKLMPYLAELAQLQGSADLEYTDVHGVCDIAHTAGLYRALQAEMTLGPDFLPAGHNLYDGVELLGALIQTIAHPTAA
jgi:hypothetical protein